MDGQIIFGDAQGSLQDVVLECSPDLLGDSLSIHLTQAPGSAAVWVIRVDVHVAQGKFRLGQFSTLSPAAGASPSRTVAIANCPGAIGWSVQVSCVTPNEIAGCTLQSSKCCVSFAGVEPVVEEAIPGEGVTILGPFPLPVTLVSPDPVPVSIEDIVDINDASPPWTETFSTVLAKNFIIFAGTGVLRSITLRIESTLAAGTYYLQLWNRATPPADGTAVTLVNSLAAPYKVQHVLGQDDVLRYDFDEHGIEFDPGACLNLSTTEFTKTGVETNHLSVITAEYRETF